MTTIFQSKIAIVWLFVFLLCGGKSVFGQSNPFQDKLTNLVRLNSYPLKIQNGNLTGDGAKLIDDSLSNTQFVALGEWHNRRAVHLFGGALFNLLHSKHGFNYLALEEDPYLGRLCSESSRNGGGAAILKLALRYPNAFHLLTEEELEMIGGIGRRSTAKSDPIWGLNQVFGATHIYERLLKIAPNAKARTIVEKLLKMALGYEKERFQKNVHYLAAIAKPADFDELRKGFSPKKDSEAEWLIDHLALSNEIFAPYNTKPTPAPEVFFNSGFKREMNMKHLFAERYREAQAKGDNLPKVLAMFGHLHLQRGISEQTDQFTLGNYLSELAVFNNMKSFHIYTVVDLPPVRQDWRGTIVNSIQNIGDKTDFGIVVDLRPLKAIAVTRNPDSSKLDPALRRLILSYDVFVVLRDGEAGSIEKLKTKNFHWYPDGN